MTNMLLFFWYQDQKIEMRDLIIVIPVTQSKSTQLKNSVGDNISLQQILANVDSWSQ